MARFLNSKLIMDEKGKLWFKFVEEDKDWKIVGGNLCGLKLQCVEYS